MKTTTAPRSRRRNTKSRKPKKKGRHMTFSGIHKRRDKRFPFAKHLSDQVKQSAEPPTVEPKRETESNGETVERWSEALMLWLSWNASYEKLVERMYKTETDGDKLDLLIDEANEFRRRAVELSENLICRQACAQHYSVPGED